MLRIPANFRLTKMSLPLFLTSSIKAPADEIAKLARKDDRRQFALECILTPPPVCSKLIMIDSLESELQTPMSQEADITSSRAMPLA